MVTPEGMVGAQGNLMRVLKARCLDLSYGDVYVCKNSLSLAFKVSALNALYILIFFNNKRIVKIALIP